MTRQTPSALALAALLIAACSTASAYPGFYGKHASRGQTGDGCVVPDKGYLIHPGPEADTESSVVLMDSTGTAVTAYVPGQVYTGTVSFPNSRSIVLAHKGALSSPESLETTTNSFLCPVEGRRVTFNTPASDVTFTWTAPEQDEGAVLMQVARATGASSSYYISDFTIASPTDEGPGLVAVGEHMDNPDDHDHAAHADDEHNDSHDEQNDSHDEHDHGAHGDDMHNDEQMPMADNDQSGASGLASTAAKALLAALLVTVFAIVH